MPIAFDSLADLKDHAFDTVIDVRSPAEFAEDRLPGAISLPVLSNEERATVGTIYTQDSPFKARKIGAALVARNAARHLEGPLAGKPGGWQPLVYCWRGGQRSGSFAGILSQVGWRAETLVGGYRSYRRLVVASLYDTPWPTPILLLDGYTGTAKTEILKRVGALGAQVLDLEGMARHRGSLFGATGTGQPSQKAFESAIAGALAGFDPDRPVLIEAESSKIGNLLVPQSLWHAMRTAPRLVIEAPLDARAAWLVHAYADLAGPALADRLAALKPYHGAAQVKAWQGLADAGDGAALAAGLMETHYDPRYAKSRAQNGGDVVGRLPVERFDEATLSDVAAKVASRLR